MTAAVPGHAAPTSTGTVAGPGELPVPWDGLDEVLRGWSGRGRLDSALAAAAGDDEWTRDDVRRRGRRVLFQRVMPVVSRLPDTVDGWLDALPAQSQRRSTTSAFVDGRVDWPRTRLAGWPPTQFAVVHRRRSPDALLSTTLAWTLRRLLEVRGDAARVLPGLDRAVTAELDSAARVLAIPPVSEVTPAVPSRQDVAAVRRAGRPWAALAELTQMLRTEDASLNQLAREQLWPDPDLRWRLFHLGCLGVVLKSLRAGGCTTRWLRPLGGTSPGPAYEVTDAAGRRWDLWFEAAGMWGHYRVDPPYRRMRTAVPGSAQSIGADIALVRPGAEAIVVECKYSADPNYIARDGYLQALAYQVEAVTALVESATAVVVGPAGVVHGTARVGTAVGSVTMSDPSGLAAVFADVVSAVGPSVTALQS